MRLATEQDEGDNQKVKLCGIHHGCEEHDEGKEYLCEAESCPFIREITKVEV